MIPRTLLTTLVALTFVSAISLMASTSGAHFFSASGSVLDNGDLAISFDEAGLGNENVNYTVTANAQAFYGCINGGGNHPQATNKEAVNATVSQDFSLSQRMDAFPVASPWTYHRRRQLSRVPVDR